MKILLYRWKAYNQFDIIRNLEKRGHVVEDIMGEMSNFEVDDAFASRFEDRMDIGNFDLVMSVNYFPIISDICQRKNIRYVSWCCDSPISTMHHESVFNSVNTIFTFDKFDQMIFEEMGAPVYYLPLCVDTDRVSQIIENDNSGKFYADLSFVGSMYNKNSYDNLYEHFPEYMKGYFDAVIKLQTEVHERYLLDDALDADMLEELSKYFVLDKTDRSFSDLDLIFSTTVLSYKIANVERRKLLTRLSLLCDVNVYTDDEDADFVKAHNCGTADDWSEAPLIFNRSKINLNLTLRSIRSGIPLRVWDILGAGGFCITNYQPELPLYFEDGVNIVWFKNTAELIEKIKYYLSHEEERRAIAKRGQELVTQYHDYSGRFDCMAEIVDGL